MSSPIIHIGLPKCASSLLQEEVFSRLDGWTFFDAACDRSGCCWNQIITRPLEDCDPEVLDSFREYWRDDVIFSREHLSSRWASYKGSQGLRNFAKLARQLGGTPRILVIVRRQDELWQSMFRYKNRYFRRPENVFGEHQLESLDFDALDCFLREECSFSDVTFFPSERMLANVASLESFCSMIFGVVPRMPARGILDRRVNASGRTDVVGYRYSAVQKALAMFPKLECIIPKEQVYIYRHKKEKFIESYASSNFALERRYGIGMKQFGYF